MTPSKFRKGCFTVNLTEKINIAEFIQLDNGIVFKTGFVLKPAFLSGERVETHKYAVFQYIGDIHPNQLTYQHLNTIWSYINEEWLPNSGYVRADSFFFESIDVSVANDHYYEVNLYVPIAAPA